MVNKLQQKFFTKPTLWVAKNLLGKYIVRIYKNKKIIGKIVETEAYIGPKDKASHAYIPPHLRKNLKQKITLRNKAEFLKGGHIYIYLVYGMHWQLNISTYKNDYPECVLIRAVEPIIANNSLRNYKAITNIRKLSNGPGKLCNYLKLDKSFYAEDLCHSKRIWIEDWGIKLKPPEIKKGPRIGIDYAGPYWSKIHWRFWIKNNPFVSKNK